MWLNGVTSTQKMRLFKKSNILVIPLDMLIDGTKNQEDFMQKIPTINHHISNPLKTLG